MPTDSKDALRAAVRVAQERYEAEADAARQARRGALVKAQEDGLTQREIAEGRGHGTGGINSHAPSR